MIIEKKNMNIHAGINTTLLSYFLNFP